VQPPAAYHSNEILSAGYERAAEECRRKVEKIIKECKRVNMRYRDPGWDLVSCHESPRNTHECDANALTRIGISSMRRVTA
jgi:hypothetical protein